jgi:hypothetical protein
MTSEKRTEIHTEDERPLVVGQPCQLAPAMILNLSDKRQCGCVECLSRDRDETPSDGVEDPPGGRVVFAEKNDARQLPQINGVADGRFYERIEAWSCQDYK